MELRAYVGVVACKIEDKPDGLVGWIEVVNSNVTPARHVRMSMAAAMLDKEPKESDFPEGSDERKAFDLVQSATWRRHIPINGDTNAVKDGTKLFWIWGTIRYIDIFGDETTVGFRRRSGHYDSKTASWALVPDQQGNEGRYPE